MNADDIDAVERRLRIRLPRFYCDFVINYPVLPEEASDIAEFEILDDPDRLIAANHAVRSGNVPRLAWPEGLFVIGESGCGDYYAIGLDAKFGRRALLEPRAWRLRRIRGHPQGVRAQSHRWR